MLTQKSFCSGKYNAIVAPIEGFRANANSLSQPPSKVGCKCSDFSFLSSNRAHRQERRNSTPSPLLLLTNLPPLPHPLKMRIRKETTHAQSNSPKLRRTQRRSKRNTRHNNGKDTSDAVQCRVVDYGNARQNVGGAEVVGGEGGAVEEGEKDVFFN